MKNTVQTKTLSLLIALAMLLSLVPGMGLTAYAADSSYEFTTSSGVLTYTNNIITVTAGYCDGDGIDLRSGRVPVQITAVDGWMITKIEMVCKYTNVSPSADEITATNGTVTTQGKISKGTTVTIDNINANSTSISRNKSGWVEFNQFKIYYGIAHTHSFTYSVNGATITATCGEGCDITEGLTLTISAPTGDLTADGTKTFPATLSTGYNTTAFPGTYAITYTKDGAEFTGTPTEAGEYTASVTVGTATASVSYTVAAPEPTVGADGLSITVSNAGEFKYIIVISGEYDNYKDIKTNKDKAAYYYGISAAKLEQAGGSYVFVTPAEGKYTVCIRLTDGTDKIYTLTVAAPVPPTHTFDVEVAGTVVTFTTDSEIKMLRFALGEGITDMTAMRAAAGVRGFTGSRFANGSFTMTVLPAGTYSYAVEYTDGIQEFGEFTVEENASKTPIITAEGVTGNWSLIARIKYAPGTITDPADFHGVAGLRVLYAPAEGSTATYRKGVLTGEYSFVVIYTDGTYELINKTF